MKHILFVCTGNTCRSPMAEALLRKMAVDKGVEIEARSAGVATIEGLPMSEHSATILKSKDIYEKKTSQQLTAELVQWADLILTMTMNHKSNIVEQFPQAVDKLFTLKEFTAADDPVSVQLLEEQAKLASELQLKQSLSQEITEEEKARWFELADKIPNHDIIDPFGGTIEDYEHSALDIEAALQKLVEKLKLI